MIKRIKTWLKHRLRRGLDLPNLETRLKVIENQFSQELTSIKARLEARELFVTSYWYEGNYWEPPVQTALRDLCKPGMVVFDVGANFGGLTLVMSRLVGPRGVVCAFEASPRIIDKCQRNLVLNGCHNVQLYHTAVYHTSHQTVPIYAGSHLNDSIYTGDAATIATAHVPTLALDDFVQSTGLVPQVLKLDIEGAEFDALKGLLGTITTAHPFLILEQQPQDTRCLELLQQQGYLAIDLSTYQEIKTAADYPPGADIRNTLFVHHDRLSEVCYRPPFTFLEVAKLNAEDFMPLIDGSVVQKTNLTLGPGRYLIDVDFTAEGTSNEMMCGVKVGDEVIFRYHAYTKILAETYRDWVIHLNKNSAVTLYFEFLNQTSDPTFRVHGARLVQVQEFNTSPPWLYV